MGYLCILNSLILIEYCVGCVYMSTYSALLYCYCFSKIVAKYQISARSSSWSSIWYYPGIWTLKSSRIQLWLDLDNWNLGHPCKIEKKHRKCNHPHCAWLCLCCSLFWIVVLLLCCCLYRDYDGKLFKSRGWFIKCFVSSKTAPSNLPVSGFSTGTFSDLSTLLGGSSILWKLSYRGVSLGCTTNRKDRSIYCQRSGHW